MALLQSVTPRELYGRRKLEVFAPATLERLGEIEVASADDVREAVARARVAQAEWAARSFEARGRFLLRARDLLVERAETIADVICRDTGKPRFEAMTSEILGGCDALTFYAKNAGRLLRDEKKRLHLMKTKKVVLSYRPMGVIGIITPWNFPFLLSLNPAVQALMAGNTVVLKPSEITPFVGLALADLFASAGLPENVFQVVTGDGATGAALVDSGCDKISFTGSERTGRKIAESCGRALVPCTLELGGKDPMIVCDDADIERAARGAVWGAFTNSGQVCMSTERVYVVEPVAKPFIARVVELTKELRQGPDSEGEADLGAITSPAQLEIIEQHVADAVAKGAKILCGGRRNPAFRGLFFEPTVLVDVNHDMAIMRAETFGPCLPIQVVKDEDEAVRLANDSSYGLQASVWTRDSWKGKRLANRIAAGGVVVDDCMVGYAISESPFGGVKDSGIGRVNGELGLKSCCHVQSVVLPRMRGKREMLWYPYSAKTLGIARRALRLLYQSPLGKLLGS